MITSLTQEQKSKMLEYKNKWIKIGLSTERFTKSDAKIIINKFYTDILKREQVPVFVFDNPKIAWIATLYIKVLYKKLHKTNRYNLIKEVRNEVGNEV